MDQPLPLQIDEQTKEEARKIYFISNYRNDPVNLTPGQMLVLKTIAEEFKEAFEHLGQISPEMLFFILKLVEAEHKCSDKVAAKLKISKFTVRTQLERAKYKLGMKSNLQLLLMFSMTMQDYQKRNAK